MLGVRRPAHAPAAAPLRIAAGVGWLLAIAALAPGVRAAGPVVPDSSCTTESTFKSLAGDTAASLQVINKTGATVSVWWLDYSGKRVFYQNLPPYTMYIQPTFLTHPWVITDAVGRCYRFLVMTSQHQSVTVEGDPPDPDATVNPLPSASSPPPATPPATAPPATVSPATAPASSSSPSGAPTTAAGSSAAPGSPVSQASGGPGVAAAVVVAAVVVGAAGLAATGRLPGFRRGRRG